MDPVEMTGAEFAAILATIGLNQADCAHVISVLGGKKVSDTTIWRYVHDKQPISPLAAAFMRLLFHTHRRGALADLPVMAELLAARVEREKRLVARLTRRNASQEEIALHVASARVKDLSSRLEALSAFASDPLSPFGEAYRAIAAERARIDPAYARGLRAGLSGGEE